MQVHGVADRQWHCERSRDIACRRRTIIGLIFGHASPLIVQVSNFDPFQRARVAKGQHKTSRKVGQTGIVSPRTSCNPHSAGSGVAPHRFCPGCQRIRSPRRALSRASAAIVRTKPPHTPGVFISTIASTRFCDRERKAPQPSEGFRHRVCHPWR